MNRVLSSLYHGCTKNNTTVMELNTTQYNRLKENCIMVSNLRVDSELNHIYYDKVTFGKKTSLTKKKKNIGTDKNNLWINVHKTKSRLVLITAPKAEYLRTFPNTHVFGTVLTYSHSKKPEATPPMSGYIILMLSAISFEKCKFTFSNEIYDIAAKSKANSLKSFEHHGTKGYNYSFGNKPLYGSVNGSSVSTYTTTKTQE